MNFLLVAAFARFGHRVRPFRFIYKRVRQTDRSNKSQRLLGFVFFTHHAFAASGSSGACYGWGARIGDVEKANRPVFDLDPDEGIDLKDVVSAAFHLQC